MHTDLNLDVLIMSERSPSLSALEIPNLSYTCCNRLGEGLQEHVAQL